jgi:FtsZ-interacting cell division protein ZipA
MSLLYWLPLVLIHGTCLYLWFTTEKQASDHPLGYTKQSQQSFDLPDTPQEKPDLISVFILPKDNASFSGYELIQTLGSAQMHFGEHQMFHRFNNEGQILFSICQSEAPGSFDYNNMGHLKASGITLFIDTTHALFSESTLNEFLDTAALIAEDLAGTIANEQMQPLSLNDFNHLKALCFSKETVDA